MPAEAAIYARISRDSAGEALGVERQVELCEKLAAERGWTIAERYVDNSISAFSGKRRPEYERMLDDLREGRRDGVICLDQDRLTRHLRELEDFIDLADRHGVALANVSGDHDLSTPDGRLVARLTGSVARHESEAKSARLKRETAQRARRGKPHGGRRPYGYEADQVTPRPAEAAVVRELAKRLIAGESMPTLARDLNERGIPTARGQDLIDRGDRAAGEAKRWRTTSVRSILASPRHAGLRVHLGEVVGQGDWPAILDLGVHEKVRAILGDPRRVQRGRPPTSLLTGLLRCGRCGAVLHSSRTTEKRPRFLCNASPGTAGCGRLAISATPLERHVRDLVVHALSGTRLQRLTAGRDELDPEASTQLRADEEALQQLATDHYVDRLLSRAEYLAARTALEERIEATRRAIAEAVRAPVLRDLSTDPATLRARWDAADVDWRRALTGAVIEAVVVGPGTPGRQGLDVERLTVTWKA